MFDFVQKNKRILQVFLGLIAITFATWGIESYTRFTGGRDTVASVNGSDISQREFGEQVRAQQEQVRRMFGGRVDPAAFDNPETRRAVLDQMVAERLVATETAKRNLYIDDRRLTDLILSVPEFQADGKFSEEAFERIARSQNPPLSARQFAERLRQSISFQQLAGSVGDTTIVPRAVAGRRSYPWWPVCGEDQGVLRREPGGVPHPRARARRIPRALGREPGEAGSGDRGRDQEGL